MNNILSEPLFLLMLVFAISWVLLTWWYYNSKKARAFSSVNDHEDLIAYKKPFNIYIVFSETDIIDRVALSDLVLRYKDILSNNYKVPEHISIVKSEEKEIPEVDDVNTLINDNTAPENDNSSIVQEGAPIPIEAVLNQEPENFSPTIDEELIMNSQMELMADDSIFFEESQKSVEHDFDKNQIIDDESTFDSEELFNAANDSII